MIAASDLLAGFVRTVVYGLPLVGVTYAILRAIPGISPAARVVAWWLVSMRLALWLLPLPSLALPVLPASDAPAVQRAAGASSTVPIAVVHAARPAPARDTRLTPSRASALLAGWGLGVIGLGAVAFERTRRVRRLVREAKPADQEIIRRTHEIGGALGLRAVIDVRVSPATRTPQVSGLLRPVVLLPEARLARLEGEELDMALCHELVHVRQHDLWFGLLPAVTRCLLFFNPLAHLAAREVLARARSGVRRARPRRARRGAATLRPAPALVRGRARTSRTRRCRGDRILQDPHTEANHARVQNARGAAPPCRLGGAGGRRIRAPAGVARGPSRRARSAPVGRDPCRPRRAVACRVPTTRGPGAWGRRRAPDHPRARRRPDGLGSLQRGRGQRAYERQHERRARRACRPSGTRGDAVGPSRRAAVRDSRCCRDRPRARRVRASRSPRPSAG